MKVCVADNKTTCDNEETANDEVCSDFFNSTTKNVDEDECVIAYETLCESLVNPIKYDDEHFSSEFWFQMLQEKMLKLKKFL